MKKVLIGVAVVLLVAVAIYWAEERPASASIRLHTDFVQRGEVIEGVAASGAIQPLVLLQVGTQISGVIEIVAKDWNAHVSAGETIAVLDSRRLVAQVLQDEANLERAEAEVDRVAAQLWQAERELGRRRSLARENVATLSELDNAEATARALRAQARTAAATIAQARAQLEGDRVNLRYATITSPQDGVIVSRNVDVGQTVAASLQAPTLFLIANDLTKVQVQANVPEAEIGRVHEGQRADFNVDAHPGQEFSGRVSQVRLAPTTVSNVVTYTVLVDADNPRGLLMPGMTANVTFEIARSSKDQLKVPLAATRLQPPASLVLALPEAPDGTPPPSCVYLKNGGGRLKPVAVRLGLSDGAMVAVDPVEPGSLAVGAEVVTSVETADDAAASPFVPQIPRRGGRP